MEIYEYVNSIIRISMRFIKYRIVDCYLQPIIHCSSLKKIKEFKGLHKGQRCFIIATGPSLTWADIQKLSNEITFSCNSILNVCKKNNWWPTYYTIVDGNVYEKFRSKIFQYKSKIKHFFVPLDFNYHEANAVNFVESRNFATSEIDQKIIPDRLRTLKFSTQANSVVYEGSSVVYAMIQLAIYMGFKEIYLLGCDCSQFNKHSSIAEYDVTISSSNEKIYNGLILDYEISKSYAQKHNIKIYNSTRGGCLEVFERKSLEEVLK